MKTWGTALVICVLVGCRGSEPTAPPAPKVYTVVGALTHRGAPVTTAAEVVFITASGEAIPSYYFPEKGRYEAKDLPVGIYKVSVTVPSAQGGDFLGGAYSPARTNLRIEVDAPKTFDLSL